MILGVWTGLASSNSFVWSIPSNGVFKIRSHRDISLRHLTSTRSWRRFCSARMGIYFYKNMEANLGEVFSLIAIWSHLQSLVGFKDSKIELLPHLNSAEKYKIFCWSETFWFFWKSAKVVAHQVNFILYHMEKVVLYFSHPFYGKSCSVHFFRTSVTFIIA